MRNYYRRLTVIIAFCIIITNCFSQTQKVPVDPSESLMNSQHQPEKLIEEIGLKEGMTIADIGAGRGRMTVFFSLKVGEKGRVFANDINKSALEYLEARCKKNNMSNVSIFTGIVDNPMLPAGEADIAFMASTYHHLDKPLEMLRNTIPCLKENGTLVIVERDPVKTGQTNSESPSGESIILLAEKAGYVLDRINTTLLEKHNIYYFKVRKTSNEV